MSDLFPPSAGLLISMAIRYDHSFGVLMIPFETGTIEEKQLKVLNHVAEVYRKGGDGDSQLLEEMTGAGFYQPEYEDRYLASASEKGREVALQLASELSAEV